MGNNLSVFPVTAQDIVLSYLNVFDAKRLMSANKFLFTQVKQNQCFWLKKAKILYEKDPAIFMRLRDPDLFSPWALVRHVCAADAVLQRTIANINRGEALESSYRLVDEVTSMAIDEKACLLVVHLDCHQRTEVFDLRRFGDPPLKVIHGFWIADIVIHGSLFFFRPPRDYDRFHADVYNWRVNVPMASLEPRFWDMETSRPMVRSDLFLAAYDKRAHCARAYPLCNNGYERGPIAVYFPSGTLLHDMAVRDDVVLAILLNSSDGSQHFKSFKVGSNAVLQQFAIEAPTRITHSRIAYPFILIAHPPVVRVARPRAFHTYGPRIHITGNDHRVIGGPEMLAICQDIRSSSVTESPTHGNGHEFVFLSDMINTRTIISHVGEPGTPFRLTDTAEGCWSPCILSFGLSVIFAREHRLVFRRYASDMEFVL